MPENLRSALLSLGDGNGTGASSRPRVGSRLGKFELVEQLGTGAFGEVFRATDTELDRPVAVKVLRGGAGASRDDVDRFVREARVLPGCAIPASLRFTKRDRLRMARHSSSRNSFVAKRSPPTSKMGQLNRGAPPRLSLSLPMHWLMPMPTASCIAM